MSRCGHCARQRLAKSGSLRAVTAAFGSRITRVVLTGANFGANRARSSRSCALRPREDGRPPGEDERGALPPALAYGTQSAAEWIPEPVRALRSTRRSLLNRENAQKLNTTSPSARTCGYIEIYSIAGRSSVLWHTVSPTHLPARTPSASPEATSERVQFSTNDGASRLDPTIARRTLECAELPASARE